MNRGLGLLLGAVSAATMAWIAWAIATPGDSFGNGSSFVVPSLVAAGVIGGAMGWASAPRFLRLLLVAALVCLAYWTVVPGGWWARPPPGGSQRMP